MTGIDTTGGHIYIEFPSSGQNALPFARAIQQSLKRSQTRISLTAEDAEMVTLDTTDLKFFPLIPGEKPLDMIKGKVLWSPCLRFGKNVDGGDFYYCSKENLGEIAFPYVAYAAACCILPLQERRDIVVTDMTVFAYANKRNYGIFGCQGALCPDSALGCNIGQFTVVWASIGALIGQNSTVTVKGRETIPSRIFKNMSCGPLCCPIGESELEFTVDLGKYTFGINNDGKNINWSKDKSLLHAHTVIGKAQVQVMQRDLDV